MKKTVINLFSGALMLSAMLASCGKDLPALTLDLQNPSTVGTEIAIQQNETIEIPFSVGKHEGYAVAVNVACDNDDYSVSVVMNADGKSGVVKVTSPEYVFEDATVKVTLTVTDNENARTSNQEIEVSVKSILENLTVSSNCHLVSPGAFIKFAAVKGNSTESVGTVGSVELLWEDAVGLVDSVFTLSNTELYVNVNKELAGNALVCAKDAEGTILWSWHIWVSAEDATANSMEYTYTPAEGESQTFYFMDRNLGALTSELGSADVNGCFYQWGRKDPFPGPTYERTYKTIYDAKGEVVAITSATPQVVNNIETAIKNPLTYYLHTSTNQGNYSWITNSALSVPAEDVNDLWGGVTKAKTIYDPCPAGYRVPQLAAWQFLSDNNVTKTHVDIDGNDVATTAAHTSKAGLKVARGENNFYFPYQGQTTNVTSTSSLTYSYGAGNGNPQGSLWSSQFDGNFNGTNASYFRAYTCNIRSYSLSYYATYNLHYANGVRCIKE